MPCPRASRRGRGCHTTQGHDFHHCLFGGENQEPSVHQAQILVVPYSHFFLKRWFLSPEHNFFYYWQLHFCLDPRLLTFICLSSQLGWRREVSLPPHKPCNPMNPNSNHNHKSKHSENVLPNQTKPSTQNIFSSVSFPCRDPAPSPRPNGIVYATPRPVPRPHSDRLRFYPLSLYIYYLYISFVLFYFI